jgi:hypothetical protein
VQTRIKSREKECAEGDGHPAAIYAAQLVFAFLIRHSDEDAEISKKKRYCFVSDALKEIGVSHPRFEKGDGGKYRFFGSAESKAKVALNS